MEPNDNDVDAFIDGVASPVRKRDAQTLVGLMTRVTGKKPRMWGPNIVGFGEYHYRYESGREGDAPAIAFSPRKPSTTVYLAGGTDSYDADLAVLGDHTTSVGCLYLKNLDSVDLAVLESIVANSYATATSDGFGQSAH